MSKSDAKVIRGAARTIIQEILTDELKASLLAEIEKRLEAKLTARLKGIEGFIDDAMKRIDTRSKEIQSFILRTSAPTAPNTSKQ